MSLLRSSYVRRGAFRAWHVVAVEASGRVVPRALCGAAPPAGKAWPEELARPGSGEWVCRRCRAILLDLGETP